MNEVDLVYLYIETCLEWLPPSFYALLTSLILIRFGDGLLGIINRAWKLVGRG